MNKGEQKQHTEEFDLQKLQIIEPWDRFSRSNCDRLNY